MKTSHLILIIILIAAIAVIISTVYKSDTYSNFKEAAAKPEKEVQIIGTLIKEKPIIFDTLNGTRFSFFMNDDKGNPAKVVYAGSRPQDFDKLEQVVVIGHWEDSLFRANSLLLKCPSKYKADKPEEFGEKEFKGQ
jgi:cytochrome c-type biogenesis protein CcmE